MPVNRGQGQTTRWYQLCFVPTSPDSSDDSDIESVVLPTSTPTPTPTSSSTWQELSSPWSPPLSPPPPPPPPLPPPSPLLLPLLPPPPPPPLNSEPQIDWRFPPPSPDFLPRSPPLQPMQSWAESTMFNIQLQHFRHQPTSEGHVFEADQSDCSMNSIRRVRVSEIDKLSHCPICMDEFKVGDQACRLPCNHTYCSECILRWLNNSKTCPVCRLNLDGCRFDSIDDNGLDSQPEIPPLPPSPPVVHNEASWEYFFPDFPGIPGVENSAGGDSDEANYDSACDELVDSHEDDASQSDSAPLI